MAKFYALKILLDSFGTNLPIDSSIIDALDQLIDTLIGEGQYFRQYLQYIKICLKCWWNSKRQKKGLSTDDNNPISNSAP